MSERRVVFDCNPHLLNLTNPAKPWSAPFRARFPWLQVMSPEAFLQALRDENAKPEDGQRPDGG